jgi:hypothetical protein
MLHVVAFCERAVLAAEVRAGDQEGEGQDALMWF